MSKGKTNVGLISLSGLLVAGAVYVCSPQVTVLANDDISGLIYENETVKDGGSLDSASNVIDSKETLSGTDKKESQPEKESNAGEKRSKSEKEEPEGVASKDSSENGTSEGNGKNDISASDAVETKKYIASDNVSKKANEVKIQEAEDPSKQLPAGLTITHSDGSALRADEYTVGVSSYSAENKFITINTDDYLVVSGNTNAGFIIPAGRNAHLIFNNLTLNCTNGMAFDIRKGGALNVVLADGTVNTVTSTGSCYSAIHCGPGSKFTIDDGLLNETTSGAEVIPTGGVIPDNLTIKHLTVEAGGKVSTENISITKGDNANRLDSASCGSLKVRSQGSAAVIGGTYYEDGGTMNFNGGILDVSPTDSAIGDIQGSAAAIGGGCSAAGTTPNDKITFNGAKIKVQSTYHGAAIGGGHNFTGYKETLPKFAETQSTHPSAMGNITINAGYIFAKNGGHGNTIGKGCGGELTPMNADDYTFLMTGGTVEATAVTNLAIGSTWALGATDYENGKASSKQSKIIISGGSLRLNKDGVDTQAAFDGKAYGEDGNELFMTRINLTGYDKVKKDDKSTDTSANPVESMNMSIAGMAYNYGSPTYIDSTKSLYFWLPKNNEGKEISVELNVNDADGNHIPMDDFTITGEQQKSGNLLKQWSLFTVDVSRVPETDRLKKKYDGAPFTKAEIQSLLNKLFGDGIDVDKPEGGKLTASMDATHISQVQSKKISDNGDGTYSPVENTEIKDILEQAGVGKYELVISSTQYGTDTSKGFNDSFWGHRGTYDYVEITPASSAVTTDISRQDNQVTSDKTIHLTTEVRPADGESAACEAPRGKVEYYMVIEDGTKDGRLVKVAESDLKPVMDTTDPGKEGTKDFGGASYHYSQATFDWTPEADVSYARNANNEYRIVTKYVPGANPNDKSNAVNYTEGQTENPNVEIIPITNFTVDETTKTVGGEETTTPIMGEETTDITREFIFDENGGEGSNSVKLTPKDSDGSFAGDYTYATSDDSVGSIDKDGNVFFHKTGLVTFTITKTVRTGDGKYITLNKRITYTVKPKEESQKADNTANAGNLEKADPTKKMALKASDASNDTTSRPKTGDRSSVYMWTGVFAAAVSAVALLRKRRRK